MMEATSPVGAPKHLQPPKSPSHGLIMDEEQFSNYQMSPVSRGSMEDDVHQSADRRISQPQYLWPEAITERYNEQANLLSGESRRSPSPEVLRSNSHESAPNDVEKTAAIPSVTLHRSGYILFMVFIYASLALAAWILICVLTFKPPAADP